MKKRKRRITKRADKRISHVIKPKELSLEDWQVKLRNQIAEERRFRMKNIGTEPIFSTFEVFNPETDKRYPVVIRGEALGINYCSCPDFSVNTLGTCKHVEYVLRKLRKKKGGRRLLKQGYVSEHSSITLRYGVKRYAVLVTGTHANNELKELAVRFFDSNGVLTEWGFKHFDEFTRQADNLDDDLRYHDDAMSFIAQIRDGIKRRERLKKIFPQGIKTPIFKKLLKTDLFPYQREGVLFAVRAGRGLIADDMGLGKTVEAIGVSEIMACYFGIGKVLIVCPASLKHQWFKEIKQFTNRSAQVIQGLLHTRRGLYKDETFFKITNYDVIHRDIKVIESWAPDLIILDEAQRIKNWKTRLARSVKQLSSTYALVLTGTPLENRLQELHSIVEFIDKHHLGPLFRFLDTHQMTDDAGKVIGYRNLNALGSSLEPILIRRRRKEVLSQLPKRVDKNYFVSMTSQQMQIHEENREIVARIVSKWRRYHFLSEEDKQRLMRALQNMRMVCDNTYLVDKETIHGKKIDELEEQLQEILERPQVKVVIFSQWVRMLELVRNMLGVNGWRYMYLHGGVPSRKRGSLIQIFRDEPDCRIFISTEAGGLGLNLQNAEVVINLDLPWNPAVLEQRIGRVHRLGQRQPVRVINFIAEGSIESGMLSLLRFKQSMFAGVLDRGANEVYMGTTRFNRFMKTVETATGSIDTDKLQPSQVEIKEADDDAKTAQEEIDESRPETEEGRQKGEANIIFDKQMLRDFLQTGARLFDNLSRQLDDKDRTGLPGQKTINIPLPDDNTVKKLIQVGAVIKDILKGDGSEG
ncbi:MAG: DEAD/DEAH box helicase [Candidatus Omnitrophota bacterium]